LNEFTARQRLLRAQQLGHALEDSPVSGSRTRLFNALVVE
jgi:hypothetical protein